MNSNLIEFILNYKYELDSLYFDESILNSYNLNKEFLEDKNIILKENNKFYLDMNNNIVFNIIENESINQIKNIDIKNDVKFIADLIRKKYKSVLAIVLIGSASRNKITKNSDLDFFIISLRKIKSIKLDNYSNFKLDFLIKTKKEFQNDYFRNTELILWTLKYGITLYNESFFKNYRSILQLNNFENILEEKRRQINRNINFLYEYKELIDKEGFIYYLQKNYYYLMRYCLYKRKIIPKSKHELENQIKKHNIKNKLLSQYKNILNKKILNRIEYINFVSDIHNNYIDI